MSKNPQRKRPPYELIFMAFIALAPVVGSYLAYHFWSPGRFVNYGELLTPGPLPDIFLERVDGADFRFSQLRGKWIFVTVDPGACPEGCRDKLYKIRQLRLTQGKDMDRVERVWLLDDAGTPNPGVVAEHPGLWPVKAAGDALKRLALNGAPRDYIYLVDPLGNLMMRYPENADPSKMAKDIARLLKVSRIG